MSSLMCSPGLNCLSNDQVITRLPLPSSVLIFVLCLSHCHRSLVLQEGTSGAFSERWQSGDHMERDGEKQIWAGYLRVLALFDPDKLVSS